MNSEQLKLLIEQVKSKLNITWDEEITNKRVEDIVNDSIPEVCDLIGVSTDFDFSKPGQERKLFKNYCFYEWNNASDEFTKNYIDDILRIRSKYEVAGSDD